MNGIRCLQDLRARKLSLPLNFLQKSFAVTPAKAGIQSFQYVLDADSRRGDCILVFCKGLLYYQAGIISSLAAHRDDPLRRYLVDRSSRHRSKKLLLQHVIEHHLLKKNERVSITFGLHSKECALPAVQNEIRRRCGVEVWTDLV